MALQIRGIQHVILTVSDPTRSAAFYEKVLGVKPFPGDGQHGDRTEERRWT